MPDAAGRGETVDMPPMPPAPRSIASEMRVSVGTVRTADPTSTLERCTVVGVMKPRIPSERLSRFAVRVATMKDAPTMAPDAVPIIT